MNTEKLFDYMIVELAKVYVKTRFSKHYSNDTTSLINKFNEDNDFNFIKLTLFPFLVSIANGKKRELIKAFDYNFLPIYYGIIHRQIAIELSTKKKFSAISIVDNKAIIDLANYDMNPTGEEIKFIDNSILAINMKYNEFSNRDYTDIISISKNYPAYKDFHDSYSQANYVENTTLKNGFMNSIFENEYAIEAEFVH